MTLYVIIMTITYPNYMYVMGYGHSGHATCHVKNGARLHKSQASSFSLTALAKVKATSLLNVDHVDFHDAVDKHFCHLFRASLNQYTRSDEIVCGCSVNPWSIAVKYSLLIAFCFYFWSTGCSSRG